MKYVYVCTYICIVKVKKDFINNYCESMQQHGSPKKQALQNSRYFLDIKLIEAELIPWINESRYVVKATM